MLPRWVVLPGEKSVKTRKRMRARTLHHAHKRDTERERTRAGIREEMEKVGRAQERVREGAHALTWFTHTNAKRETVRETRRERDREDKYHHM